VDETVIEGADMSNVLITPEDLEGAIETPRGLPGGMDNAVD